MLYEMGCREIYLHSDELNCDLDWALDVCQSLAGLGHPDLFFQCNVRADRVTEELARQLRRMNCWLVRVGIESANQRVLDGVKKAITVPQIEQACALLRAQGCKVFGFLMMFQVWEEQGRLMYETVEEVSNTLNFAERMYKEGRINYMGWAAATPVQGSELYDAAARHGLCGPEYYPGEFWDISRHFPQISSRHVSQLNRRGLRLQARMALKNGSIGWSNWKRLLSKGCAMIMG